LRIPQRYGCLDLFLEYFCSFYASKCGFTIQNKKKVLLIKRIRAGTLEIYWDDDFWADHDEDCHGTIDLDLVDDCPGGFRWSCCNGPGDEEACTVGPHKLDEKFKPEVKKRRVWD
jgi:hypothetical protein